MLEKETSLFSVLDGRYVWVIDQVRGQDCWILAKFRSIFACLWTKTKPRSINTKNNNDQYSVMLTKLAWPMNDYMEKDDYFSSPLWFRTMSHEAQQLASCLRCNWEPGLSFCIILFKFFLPTISTILSPILEFHHFGKFTSCMTFFWVVIRTIYHSCPIINTHVKLT